ncbi:hypothetical protein CKY39_10340 [Variovorax boronicumulans]|uniref:Uncharacterized protein n=1 Tax=Variovorax boronicumulans TaxID=436515 RepID=A0A250DHF8_9BURK|nr:hypothetical protein CKY39_10340 [Variovorax boronicumulans]
MIDVIAAVFRVTKDHQLASDTAIDIASIERKEIDSDGRIGRVIARTGGVELFESRLMEFRITQRALQFHEVGRPAFVGDAFPPHGVEQPASAFLVGAKVIRLRRQFSEVGSP